MLDRLVVKELLQAAGAVIFPGETGTRSAMARATAKAAYAWDATWLPSRQTSALAQASMKGDANALTALIDGGADPSASDGRGYTPLHHAVARGLAPIAALLLQRGVRFSVADRRGQTPLALPFASRNTLHAIRQHYHRLPGPGVPLTGSVRARRWAEQLDRDGIVRVSGVIDASHLKRLRTGFARFVTELDNKLAGGNGTYQRWEEEAHFWPKERYYETNNPFRHSPALVELCLHSELISAMRLYLRKPAFIHRAQGYRYLPAMQPSGSQFEWHHDVEEKRFKMMVLLTDVGENDQYMSYVIGSHRLMHPYDMFLSNVASLDYCRRHLSTVEVFRATGRAGDIILFDSNGVHRSTRRESGRLRDVYIVAYTADKTYLWGADVDRAVLDRLPFEGPHPFERLLTAPKMWELPEGTRAMTWERSLPRVESWI